MRLTEVYFYFEGEVKMTAVSNAVEESDCSDPVYPVPGQSKAVLFFHFNFHTHFSRRTSQFGLSVINLVKFQGGTK